MLTLISLLQKKSLQAPDDIAYLFLEEGKKENGSLTFGELDTQARAIAAYLLKNNLLGQRVLLVYPPGLDFISAFMGCLYAGVIAVPVHCPKEYEFEKASGVIEVIAEDADISAIFTTKNYLVRLKNIFIHKEILIEDFHAINLHASDVYEMPVISEETIAYLQYSSGSTSAPKAAIIRHRNLIFSIMQSAKAWHYTKKSITLTWAPHSHVYGLVCGLLVPLSQGCLAIIMSPDVFIRRPLIWLQVITKYRVTHSGCPNFGYQQCIQKINNSDLAQLDLKSWRVAVNGGENIQYDTIRKFSEKFSVCGFQLKYFCPAYGMSEMTGTIAVTSYTKNPKILIMGDNKKNRKNKLISNGKLLPELQVVIVDYETQLPVVAGEVGEIWVSGPSLVSGYWQREQETQEVFNKTLPGYDALFFRTGDIGFIKDAEIYITGRLKEMMIVYGKKYYPLDLEKIAVIALKEYPIGGQCAVFSIVTSQKENIIFLQEVQANIDIIMAENIIKIIRLAMLEQFGIHLHEIVLVKENSLPKTVSGKLQRRLCREKYVNNHLEIYSILSINSHQKINRDDFINIISSVLEISRNKINLNAPLSDYGFDSISIVQLTQQLNDAYHLDITPAIFYEYATFSEFIGDLIEKNTKNKSVEEAKIVNTQIKDIAVIGMSGVFPGAKDIDAFWDNLLQGKDCINEIPDSRWHWQDYYGDASQDVNKTKIKWGGFIDGIAEFDADFFKISPREAELTDPQQRIFLQIVWKAIEDAGYATAALSKVSTGLFVGVFNNDYAELLQKNNITDAYVTTGVTHSILANRVSYLLNFHGPSEAIDTACSSSLVAIHHAVRAIQSGDCEVAIAGGVNALLTPTVYLIASKAGMLSEEGRCKTFDKNANGYVRGEGAAAIVLKSYDQAVLDGDHIYGVIKGTAVNHGGHVSSLTVPNPNAQADVITAACRRAKVDIETIQYIETHGTGTSLGDPVETNGLKKAFDLIYKEQNKNPQKKYYCGLGSVKTHIGHLEAAAGIAGVIKILLAMQYEKMPANLHFKELNPYIDLLESPFYLVNNTQEWKKSQDSVPRRAGVSSFGYGGTNAHIILEESQNDKISKILPESQNFPYLIALSAPTELALRQRIIDLTIVLKDPQYTNLSLAALSFTLNAGRNHFSKRCIIVAENLAELKETLDQIQNNKIPDNYIININHTDKTRIRPIFEELFQLLINDLNSWANLSLKIVRNKLFALGNFYTEGYDLDWEELHIGEKRRISLPTYPFAKEYYWIPENINKKSITVNQEIILANAIENSQLSLVNIQDNIIQHVCDLLKINAHKINLTASLSELGFDSIAFKELSVKLEKQYNLELNPALFFTYHTIEKLSQYLYDNYFKNKIFLTNNIIPEENNTNTNKIEPIAVIGMSAYFPESKDLNEFWQHLEAEHDLVNEIPPERWKWQDYYGDAKKDPTKTNSKWGATLKSIDQFDAEFFNISAREANLMDPQHRLFLEIVWKTIEDAGYDPLSLSGKNVGLFAGVEFHEYQTLIHTSKKIFHGHLATGNSHAMLANRVSYFLNLQGPSEVIDTACSSSLVALHRAVGALRNGECSMAIAGGVSLMMNPDTFVITSQLGALSPDGRCKTFDKAANGYVKGEGVAALLLKPLSQAQKDGDAIYGVIKGIAVNHGGKAQSLTAPNAVAQTQVLMQAYRQANITPDTISYIEAHGTGTELGDPIEIEGLKQAFAGLMLQKNKINFCGLGSVKTNIGHLEPASGMAGVIKVLLAMQHKKIPATLHQKEINSYIDLNNSPFYIVNKTQNWAQLIDEYNNIIPRRAGVSSFGFGGTNAHVLLEEAPEKIESDSNPNPYYLLTLSAKTEESLKKKIADLLLWLRNNITQFNLAELCYTLNIGRSDFDYRGAWVVSSAEELLTSLENNVIQYNNISSDINNINLSESYQSIFNNLKNNISPNQYHEQLLILADLYIKKFVISWKEFYSNLTDNKLQKISGLPTYPFNKQRYWFDAELQNNNYVNKLITSEAINTTDLHTATMEYLKQIFAEKLRIPADKFSVDATYEVYGVDSLIGLEITNRLEEDFSGIPKTILYEKSQIRELALYLQKKYHDKLEKLFDASSLIIPIIPIIPIISALETNIVIEKNIVIENDIAIIGISGIYPQAKDLNQFWDNLIQGKDCIEDIPEDRWNYKDYPVMVGEKEKFYNKGGFISDIDKFDPLFFGIAPREAALMDPQERLFLQSAWATLEDACYTRDKLKQVAHNNIGVFVGVTYNFYPLFIAEEWAKGNRLPLDIQNFSVANRVSYFLNLNGPSYVVDTACSSSLSAIHLACESLLRGECEMAIAGGVNLSLHPAKYHFLGGYGFMSDQGRCASFAEGGSGYVPGEGVGSVLLKPLKLAERDGDRIYGVIKASTMNHGGKTSGYTVPNPNAQADLIKAALVKSKIDPRTISYIEAHGTGTSLGDPIELRGLQEAFEEYTQDKQYCAVGSVKSNIGHLESAAGISQLTKVILQLKYKKLVPSLHAKILNSYIDFEKTPFYVQQQLSEWMSVGNSPRRAGVSSFGAGGTNAHVIIEEYIQKNLTQNSKIINKPFIFLLSAFNSERLQKYAEIMLNYLHTEKDNNKNNIEAWLTQVCYCLQLGRENMATKIAIIAADYADLIFKLQKYIEQPAISISLLWVSSPHELLVKSWLNGDAVSWIEIYPGGVPQILSLPTYPFAKRRCWIQASPILPITPVVPVLTSPEAALATEIKIEKDDIAEWLYCSQWEKSQRENIANKLNDGQWLIFSDHELGFILQDNLGKKSCYYCFAGETYSQISENAVYINPDAVDDYLKFLTQNKTTLKGIIYLWPLLDDEKQDLLNQRMVNLFKALIQQKFENKILFCLITRGSQAVINLDATQIWQHSLWSLARIFLSEQPNYQVLLLDLDNTKNLRNEAKIVVDELEFFQQKENHIAYRNQERFAIRLVKPNAENQKNWQSPHTAIVTGGLGALGSEVAKWLISQGTQYLLLTGSSELPDRSRWSESHSSELQEKINNIIMLEKFGVHIKYAAVDVADKEKMQQVIADTELEWSKPIQGVFHLAGITTDSITIENLSPELLKKVISVKAQGALVLHEIFNKPDLTCFVLFSSIAALPFFGMSGLSAYAMANEFLDGLAVMRQNQGLPALSINWAAWADKGMSFKYNHSAFLEAVGMSTIAIKQGIKILQYLLSRSITNVIVFKIRWEKFMQVNAEARKLPFFSHFLVSNMIDNQAAKKNILDLNREQLVILVIKLLANLLELEIVEVDPDAPYQNFGLDSIIGIKFVGKLDEKFPGIVSPMDLYRYPSVNQLVNYIMQSCETELKSEILNNKDLSLDEIANLTDDEVSKLIEEELSDLGDLK